MSSEVNPLDRRLSAEIKAAEKALRDAIAAATRAEKTRAAAIRARRKAGVGADPPEIPEKVAGLLALARGDRRASCVGMTIRSAILSVLSADGFPRLPIAEVAARAWRAGWRPNMVGVPASAPDPDQFFGCARRLIELDREGRTFWIRDEFRAAFVDPSSPERARLLEARSARRAATFAGEAEEILRQHRRPMAAAAILSRIVGRGRARPAGSERAQAGKLESILAGKPGVFRRLEDGRWGLVEPGAASEHLPAKAAVRRR